jgi:hypothetical protein
MTYLNSKRDGASGRSAGLAAGRWERLLILGLAASLLAGCGLRAGERPTRLIGMEAPQRAYDFAEPTGDWGLFRLEGGTAGFELRDAALVGWVPADRGYLRTLIPARYDDTAISAAVQQLDGSRGNGFGVMCRADEAGNGYYFMISSDRAFAILKATPDQADPVPIIDWQHHPAVQSGDTVNQIDAICAGDYLAFYANGQFLAEASDTTFTSGSVGVALGAAGEDLTVRFDDVAIREATLLSG